MSLKVKNTFLVVDEQSIQDEDEDSNSETIWRRRATAPAATGLRMTQSLPNSPRLGASAKADISDATSVGDTEGTESKAAGYDTPEEFLDECQSEFGQCWSASAEDAMNYSVADPCVWQGWMISNMVPFDMHGLGDGLCTPACAPHEAEEPGVWGSEVTLMMRNVPKKLTQHALLEEINSRGFAGTYDFVYLPMDQDSNINRGYSFINFVDPAYAAAFKALYEGRQLSQYSSRKFIAILQAEIQGLEANREHFFTTHAAQEDSGPQTLFLRQPHATPAKSSEVSEQCRGVRLKGAAATPAKSTLSRIASKYCAALVSGEQGQAPPAKKRSAVNFCPYCGGGAEESFKFCQFCGKSLCL
mmetsp:Transcript_100818/g.285491  ORF Transcript_100818/g.285491 Transcript_100818/m.285491 type:complete len:358 (+) Transcript_100818:2-1075(+)